MPDFERAFRDLELHMLRDDEVKTAYTKGKHAGLDRARMEIALIAAVVAVIVLVAAVCAM